MKILFFDIDGTLIDSGGAGKLAIETAFESELGLGPPTVPIPYAGRTDRAIVADILRHHNVDDSAGNIDRVLQAYLSHLPNCLAQRQGKTLPGVRLLLEKLVGRDDVVLALLTGNVAAGAENKLKYFDLYHFFQCGGYADDLHDRNDIARAARVCAEKHVGRPFDESVTMWVIGDTPHDVTCGRVIGARVLAVATGSHTVDQLQSSTPDHVVSDLSDTAKILDLWRK